MILALLAAATTLFTIPQQSFTTGTTPLPSTNIPLGAGGIFMTMTTDPMTDPATSVALCLDASFDGGATWFSEQHPPDPTTGLVCYAYSLHVGGQLRGRDGNVLVPQPPWSFGVPLYEPTNPNRKLRGTIFVVGSISIGPGTVQVTQ